VLKPQFQLEYSNSFAERSSFGIGISSGGTRAGYRAQSFDETQNKVKVILSGDHFSTTISSTSGSMNNVSMNIGSQLSGDVIDQEDHDQS
ncbi:hypothetical protein OAP56_02935, partial [Rickettsiaceae bacterium]|nr:hypothetical protein [Rickettsiaceae bacterium]